MNRNKKPERSALPCGAECFFLLLQGGSWNRAGPHLKNMYTQKHTGLCCALIIGCWNRQTSPDLFRCHLLLFPCLYRPSSSLPLSTAFLCSPPSSPLASFVLPRNFISPCFIASLYYLLIMSSFFQPLPPLPHLPSLHQQTFPSHTPEEWTCTQTHWHYIIHCSRCRLCSFVWMTSSRPHLYFSASPSVGTEQASTRSLADTRVRLFTTNREKNGLRLFQLVSGHFKLSQGIKRICYFLF